MAEGILVEVQDGFAHIQFIDRTKVGPALTKLLELGGPEMIDIDTRSNPRKTYIVPEGMAMEAGLLDDSRPSGAPPDRAPDESWTVAQLVDYASREEINLGGATKKADILAAITAANNPGVSPAQE